MISVAMAVYNGEKYLKDQLDSILNQTTPVDEIVIVDDCSNDQSIDIIREYQKENSQIRLYQNAVNLGYKNNFRKAVQLCQGDLVFLCDQDDFWYPEKVAVMKRIMDTSPNIQVLASSFEFMDSKGKVYYVKPRRGMSNNNLYLKPVEKNGLVPVKFEEFCSHNYFQGCSMVLDREAVTEYLKHWTDLMPHDWLIALLASHEEGFYFLNTPLFRYRTHSRNTIGIPKGRKNEEWARLKFAEDMLDAMNTISYIWPEEFRKNRSYQERMMFCKEHITAIKHRDTVRLIMQNANPIYKELKTYRARLMDLLFSLSNK